MDKFEKKMANKDLRHKEKEIIKKWDAESKKGKNGHLKACPGYKDHSKQKRIPLTVPCLTCKRHFCSEECQQRHKELCEAKFYAAETKDYVILIDVCKEIVSRYIDKNAKIKQEWIDKYDLGENHNSWYGFYMLYRNNRDLEEALKILKKRDPEYYNKIKGNVHSFLW